MNSHKKVDYKTFCFDYQGNVLYFYYNTDHPIMMKNLKFELAKVKVFSKDNRLYKCSIWSHPHLNMTLDWNEEYFTKLFHGLNMFELEGSTD